MKKIKTTIIVTACVLFTAAAFGTDLIAKFSGIDTNGMPVNYPSTLANVASNNAAGLTNFTSITITNSAGAWLTAAGIVTASVVLTNSQIAWLTNATSGQCFPMGNTAGVWTNWDNASLLVNSGDSVAVTNISGTGGATLMNSWFQALH